MLMEKDALRTAELEKMQRIEELKRESEAIDVSAFEETPPTSVLCEYLFMCLRLCVCVYVYMCIFNAL